MALTQSDLEGHVVRLLGMVNNRAAASHWIEALEAVPVEGLAGLIGRLSRQNVERPGHVQFEAEEIIALRESAQAVLAMRLSRENIAATARLERASNRVACVGVLISVVGVVIAGLQLWAALR